MDTTRLKEVGMNFFFELVAGVSTYRLSVLGFCVGLMSRANRFWLFGMCDAVAALESILSERYSLVVVWLVAEEIRLVRGIGDD